MNRLCAVIAFILLTSLPCANNTNAAIQKSDTSFLKLRACNHTDYLRIVIEGPEAVISKGKISHKNKDIMVSFPDTGFTIKKKELPVTYRTDKDVVTFTPDRFSKLKTFSLKNPSRLVIDVYQKKAGKKTQNSAKSLQEMSKKKHKNLIPPNPPLEKGGMGGFSDKSTEIEENKTVAKNLEKSNGDYGFIPERYKNLWNLLKSGKYYGVLKELPLYKPEDAGSIAAYHFIYGEACNNLEKYLKAVEEYRLAYIYSSNNELKEQALIKRAGLYLKLKLLYEARADYLVFIKYFPSSKYIKVAHLGLAKSLSGIGLFNKAVEHYKKGGRNSEALFGKANTLQRLKKVRKARKAYADAILVDKTYYEKSPETYYLIGENMRMAGEIEDARRHLSAIHYGPYKDDASISLGLIAMDESNTEEAIRRFKSAVNSRDRKIKVRALYNLSFAFLKAGKLKESISRLEEIRYRYLESSMYKSTLLELSKLYRKDGRVKDSIFLLKELVYGKQPPREAFSEIETLLLEVSQKAKKGGDDVEFVALWNEVDQWLLDETRDEFLLKIAKRLRHEGKHFLNITSWLVENASKKVRIPAAIDLMDYYIAMGNIDTSKKYLDIVKDLKESGDAVLRVEVKIYRATGDLKSALKKLLLIEKFEKGDLEMLGSIISDFKKAGAKEMQEAIAFYEKALKKSEWDAEDYIRLADILYKKNEINRALKYYRIGNKKKPEDEWATYRIGYAVGIPESKEMFSRLQKGDTLLSRMAKTKLMEINLLDRVAEVY